MLLGHALCTCMLCTGGVGDVGDGSDRMGLCSPPFVVVVTSLPLMSFINIGMGLCVALIIMKFMKHMQNALQAPQRKYLVCVYP